MKKITTLIVAFVLAFSFTSCTEDSLQSYLVESQEKAGFLTFDIPASLLQLKTDDVSAETKATLKTLNKINIVALPSNADNSAVVEAEKAQLDKIFKGAAYKSLMRFSHEDIKIQLYYTGNGDEIDEVIAYAYAASKGIGVARILGDNMNPSDIMKMMSEVKFNSKGVDFSKLSALF
ncbi:MAG: DUF4252 domain-containing protein [Flavobacteriaceae bacterium]|nr:DUF4252 domain-containing protein [Flavobacteriaceae bacterium]